MLAIALKHTAVSLHTFCTIYILSHTNYQISYTLFLSHMSLPPPINVYLEL